MAATEKRKREERKQRSEEHKVLASLHPDDGEERDGRIWSAAHGHWHDKYGQEVR